MLNVQMDREIATGYKSGCQIARRMTEHWATESLYCVACDHEHLEPMPCNSQAIDFTCGICKAPYQLKASQKWSERRVPDAGYDAMVRAMRSDRVPNLLVLQYSARDWLVVNLLVVPSFFFSLAAVEKRRPLGPNARRAGWVGCNILLQRIASEGKIRLVVDGDPIPSTEVRARYQRVRPLARLKAGVRGWTLDVLRLIKQLPASFDLSQAYSFERELANLYPGNRNIRPKIRQQLQVLRDLGFLRFEGRGKYSLIRSN